MRAKQMIAELSEARGYPKVSLYFPTHVSGPEIRQDPIRLKNAVQDATAQLKEKGWEDGDCEAFFEEAMRLHGDEEFWKHQKNGLAVFVEKGRTRHFKLSFAPREEVMVAEAYYLLPLCRMAGTGETFHVLALNREHARLFDADAKGMVERPIAITPEHMIEKRGYSDFNDDTGFHPNSRGSQGGGAEGVPQVHSNGTAKSEQTDKELARWLDYVANEAGDALADSEAPIVLVGGERIVGWFRDAKESNLNLAEGAVMKNTEGMEDDAMFEAALAEVSDMLEAPRKQAAEQVIARVDSGEENASTDLEAIAEAAEQGRVDTALIDFEGRDGTRAEALDRIAGATLANGGTVLALPSLTDERLSPAAALYRY